MSDVRKSRPLRSVSGSVLGFGLAGCGAGVLAGGCLGAQLQERAIGPDPTPLAEVRWTYGTFYGGSALGMLAGATFGVLRARADRRRAVADAERGDAPSPADG